MKKKLQWLTILLFSLCAHAQSKKFSFGIIGGPSLVNLTKWEYGPGGTSYRLSVSAGTFANYHLHKHFSARFNLIYTNKGTDLLPSSNSVYHIKINCFSSHFLLQAMIGKKDFMFVNAGGFFSVNGKSFLSYTETSPYTRQQMQYVGIFAKTDLGLSFAIGVQGKFSEKIKTMLELRFEMGMKNINHSAVSYGGLIQTQTLSLNAGICF